MTTLDQREKAVETEFVHQEELKFRKREKAVRNLAIWAAGRLGKTGEALDAYAQEIVAADVANPSYEATLDDIAKSLAPRGIGKPEVRQMMDRLLAAGDAAKVTSVLPSARSLPMLATTVMRTSFITIKPTTSLAEAAQLLLQTNQRGLPVLNENDNLVGILSEGDLLHRDELGVHPPAGNWLEDLLGVEENSPARIRMRTMNVATIMTKDPVHVDDHSTVNDVVTLMDRRKVAQVPVIRAGKVIGMISRFELLAALAQKLKRSD